MAPFLPRTEAQESDLSVGYTDLREGMAVEAGWSSDSTKWSTEKAAALERWLKRSLRQSYGAHDLDSLGIGSGMYTFSWLYSTKTFFTVVDQADYDLPADFGGISGDVHFMTERWEPLREIDEEELRRKRGDLSDAATGIPTHFAIRTDKPADTGQRFVMMLYPIPQDRNALLYKYALLMQTLSADNPYPLGGAAHAEMILASCLAVVESERKRQRGHRWEEFQRALRDSIHYDMRHRQGDLGPLNPVQSPYGTIDETAIAHYRGAIT